MGIKAIIDKLEDVDEKYRDLYRERNGKFELTEVEGAKTQADVDRVQVALGKEREEHKKTKEKYSIFADLDPAEVQAKLDKFPELEAAAKGKLNDEEINKIVEGRLNTVKAPLEREINKLKAQNSDFEGKIRDFTAKERQRMIHDHVREAISKAQGFTPSAAEDALVFAERMFEVTEDGKVLTKDNVGVTPGIEATVWLSDMQQRKPHWFGPTVGGGANGSRSGNNSTDNPFSHNNWNMTAQADLIRTNPARAEQMAKLAGTSVGGLKPAAPPQ